ncbi:MAG: SEL1-like repeat protein, partial [Pseudorhodobacter sp.]|nr:SEL1-like repeat protein [Pseudorhodobacter sp.]
WRAKLDPTFNAIDVTLAKIDLYVDAGRLQQLRDEKLIDGVRASGVKLDNAQKMTLADYYMNGIGVAQDVPLAQGLIRDAAFGGNSEALLTIARMDLDGQPMPDWDAPMDLTMTLALGGMLGQMNPAVCDHAGRIAQKYLTGDLLTRNPDIAFAWYKFAADLGGAKAAWRIVEFHLDAGAEQKDNAEMLHYLQLAVKRGITVDANQANRLKTVGHVDEDVLRGILGFNFSADTGRTRPSVSPYFRLAVRLDAAEVSPDSPYLKYLHEVIAFPTAPGFVFTKLAKEVLGRKGEWAGEAEAMTYLEQAADKGDAEGMELLARKLVRYRDDPARLTRAANLLTDVVARFGVPQAMNELNTLYRCQSPAAPLIADADLWRTNYAATEAETVDLGANDMIALDPFKQPELLAQMQTQALQGNPQSLANWLERVQTAPLGTDDAKRLWANRADGSDKALENFGKLEIALATNPAERNLALELMRRVYLNNGVTTALDLAVMLTDDLSRSPETGDEIIGLLTKAGNRGEGAAIRLKAQLLAATTPPEAIYDEFKTTIEERGDFLAMMFAVPFVDKDKARDYIDRAVSLMACTTKDTDELGEAYATLLSPDLTLHWRQIGLTMENGNVLGKMNLTNWQIDDFGTGNPPNELDVQKRNLAEGDLGALRSIFALTADSDLRTYDPTAAADTLVQLLRQGSAEDETWVLGLYRKIDPAVRVQIDSKIDMHGLYEKAALRGDVDAKLEYGLLLRDTARTPANLVASAKWLKEAADAGNVQAMMQYGYALAYGLGMTADPAGALTWLDKADQAGNLQARDLARLLRIGKT